MLKAIGCEPEVATGAAGGPRQPLPAYLGPERRRSPRDPGHWLLRMLDEIDYGMLLVGHDAELHYLNHAARIELDDNHPLQLQGKCLRAQRPLDATPLHDALAAAQRGLRRLVTLGAGDHRVCVSVVPLSGGGADGQGLLTLLVLGKRQVCEQLSVRGFARAVGLTPAETRVLEQLCVGVRPAEIASRAGVKIATVRTQIGTARAKTGAGSIRELVSMVAVLPPLVGALRCAGGSSIVGLIGFGTMQ
jgi:DNA-binding CsgD family transcriptional regulator